MANSTAKAPKVLSTRKPRKTAVSKKGTAKMSELVAGKPDNLKSFIFPYNEEALCASYNGYSDIADFRKFLVTPMFVRFFSEFRSISRMLPPYTAFSLLRDDFPRVSAATFEAAAEQ